MSLLTLSFIKVKNFCPTHSGSGPAIVCMFVWVFVPFENFSLVWRRHHHELFKFAHYSWPLSNEGSLACHTYCDTGHPL